jgi:hypothetical protein
VPFEAPRTAARQSANPCDFAPVAMPGLPGSRIEHKLKAMTVAE